MERRRKGSREERIAEAYLSRRGLKTVARNFSCRGGEIDLVCRDGEELVFVEVRYRGTGSLTSGEESVTWSKQQRVIRAARLYLSKHGLHNRPCRFDVVAINQRSPLSRDINWIANAFNADS